LKKKTKGRGKKSTKGEGTQQSGRAKFLKTDEPANQIAHEPTLHDSWFRRKKKWPPGGLRKGHETIENESALKQYGWGKTLCPVHAVQTSFTTGGGGAAQKLFRQGNGNEYRGERKKSTVLPIKARTINLGGARNGPFPRRDFGWKVKWARYGKVSIGGKKKIGKI